MPRYDKQSIGGAPLKGTDGPSAQLGVAASPVDLGVRRSGGSGALALAESLRHFSPKLAGFVDSYKQQVDEADSLRGARARDEQAGTSVMPTLREQSPAFQQGYMRQHGLRMSILDSEAMEQDFEAKRYTPGFDQEAFFAEHRKKALGDLAADPEAYKGYAPHFLKSEAALRAKLTTQAVEAVRAEQAAGQNTEIAQYHKELGQRTAEGNAALFEATQAKHQKLGVPREVTTGRWISALVNNQDAQPQDFDHLYIPDSSGIAPAYRKAPNGGTYHDVIQKAREAAYAKGDAALAEKIKVAAGDLAMEHTRILEENPMSITDEEGYVRLRDHLWNTPEKKAAAVVQIRKAKAEWAEKDAWLKAIRGGSSMPAMLASNTDYKKIVEKEHQSTWTTVDPANPASIARAVQTSTDLFRRTHVPDPFIASLSERVKSMTATVPNAKGEQTIPPEFRLAHSIYRSLADSNNQALGLFDDKSRLILRTFDRLGGTELERFRGATLMHTDDGKARVRQMFPNDAAEAAMRKKIVGKLDSLWSENIPIGSTPGNLQERADQILDGMKALYATSGNADVDAIFDVVMERDFNGHAWDGHGSLVRIPVDLPKEDATEYLTMVVQDAKDARIKLGKEPLKFYEVKTTTVDGETAFVVTQMGTAITPPYRVSSLATRALRAKGAALDQVAATQKAQQEARFADLTQRLEAGLIDQREFEIEMGVIKPFNRTPNDRSGLDALIEDVSNGRISPQDFEREVKRMDLTSAQEAKLAADDITAPPLVALDMPKADAGDFSVRIPVPQPLGPEVKPKQIALAKYKSDPHTALMAYGEGFKNVLFDDPNQKDKLLGFGYNVSVRSEKAVAADLKAAGISDERIPKVLSGEEAITPDEAAMLSKRVTSRSVNVAIEAVGEKAWKALPENRRAVLIDLAYQAGDNSKAFKAALLNLRKGNDKGVVAALQVSYWKEKDQKRVMDHRRNTLRLAMWESPEKFQQLVSRGI